MDVTPLVPRGRQVINSYGAGGFMISGERHDGSVLVFPEQIVALEPTQWSALTLAHMVLITEAAPRVELLLMGCGPSIQSLPPELRSALREAGIGIDLMDTGAACRTYNILMAEDRRVAALLIALD